MNKIKKAYNKLCIFALMSVAATMLSSCSSAYYERVQDEASINRPYNCDGLHIRHAMWHYKDSFGQVVDTRGRCSKGMKHGTFDFYVNGIKVAATKYERDAEVNTNCYVRGLQTIDLETCMRLSASTIANNDYTGNDYTPVIKTEPVKKSVWD